LLNEIGSLFGVLKYVCDIVVKKFTFAISSPDEFLCAEVTVKCCSPFLDLQTNIPDELEAMLTFTASGIQTIRYGILTCAEKLTRWQLNLALGTKTKK